MEGLDGTAVRGVLLGVVVAAPLGPVGVLCLRRGLLSGWRAGFVSGLGAATADGAYALVAASGYAAVTALLSELRTPLRLLGAAVLLAVAAGLLRPRRGPRGPAADPRAGPLLRAYLQVLALTLANPLTVLSFVALVAAAGLQADGPADVAVTGLAVGAGSALWWAGLATVAAGLRRSVGPRLLRRVDLGTGLVLLVLGLLLAADVVRSL